MTCIFLAQFADYRSKIKIHRMMSLPQ